MQSSLEAQTNSQSGNPLEGWREFFRINCDALFQIALLLTAAPDEAEATVVAAIDSLDVSTLPDGNALAALQERVAPRPVGLRSPPDDSKLPEAQAMLPKGLRPLLQIDPSSRVCFVMRMLLGYAASSRARMMGVEEASVKILLRIAALQLPSVVAENKRDGFIVQRA